MDKGDIRRVCEVCDARCFPWSVIVNVSYSLVYYVP